MLSLTELLPTLRQLPAPDKLRLIRILTDELDSVEELFPFEPHKIYYLPTPYNSFGAGRVLMNAMAESLGA